MLSCYSAVYVTCACCHSHIVTCFHQWVLWFLTYSLAMPSNDRVLPLCMWTSYSPIDVIQMQRNCSLIKLEIIETYNKSIFCWLLFFYFCFGWSKHKIWLAQEEKSQYEVYGSEYVKFPLHSGRYDWYAANMRLLEEETWVNLILKSWNFKFF